ncbi:MAG: VOC family protein [Spirochaetes bacterium]|nr:VOC family protein [Spirochaetota bacterium]
MKPMTTCLWFDVEAEEAVQFYTSIFPNSSAGRIVRYTKDGFEFHGKPEGSICTIEFEINGAQFIALNGGNVFKFNEAVSLIINCDSQDETDYYWEKLSEGGDPGAQQCGWLKDKYGVSWQIVPVEFTDIISSTDKTIAEKAMKILFTMKKLDVNELKKALI